MMKLTSWSGRLTAAVGLTLTLSLIGLSTANGQTVGEPEGSAAKAQKAKVICITQYGDPAYGGYRTRPHKCVLHKRGAYPVVGANTAALKDLSWLRWGGKTARATGKLGISTYGPAPAAVKLSKLRDRCGTKVYTHANIRYEVDGKNYRWNFPLDNCLT